MKGTLSAGNFSPEAGGGETEGAVAVFAGGVAAAGVDDADGVGAAILLAEDEALVPPGNSSLVKYKNPPTPMPTIHTTATARGHIQFATVREGGGFFTCGVE